MLKGSLEKIPDTDHDCPAVDIPYRLRNWGKLLHRLEGRDNQAELGRCLMDFFEAVRAISWQLMSCCAAVRGSQFPIKLSGAVFLMPG